MISDSVLENWFIMNKDLQPHAKPNSTKMTTYSTVLGSSVLPIQTLVGTVISSRSDSLFTPTHIQQHYKYLYFFRIRYTRRYRLSLRKSSNFWCLWRAWRLVHLHRLWIWTSFWAWYPVSKRARPWTYANVRKPQRLRATCMLNHLKDCCKHSVHFYMIFSSNSKNLQKRGLWKNIYFVCKSCTKG